MKQKIALVYKENEQYEVEYVWALKEGNYYRIKNIPFFAKNIAYDDLVAVEIDNDELYFDSLIEPSGNSVIRLITINNEDVKNIGKELVNLGCGWEGSHIKNLIAINVPKNIAYNQIKAYLDKGEADKRWGYEEACLGFK